MADLDDLIALEPIGGRPEKIKQTHLDRVVTPYIRVSTNEQARDHQGSLAAQYAQRDKARDWGWPDSRIKVVDRDLGLSATSTAARLGFLEMLAMIGRGEVGMVMALSVDRLARKSADFEHLLDI